MEKQLAIQYQNQKLRNNLIKDDRTRDLAEMKQNLKEQVDALVISLQRRELTQAQYQERFGLIAANYRKDEAEVNDRYNKKAADDAKKKAEDVAKAEERAFEIRLKNQERVIKLLLDGGAEEIALFEIDAKRKIASARKSGEDVNLVIAEIGQKE